MADGSFRTDLPAAWLATACIALMHACSDSVRAGTISHSDAERILPHGPRPVHQRRAQVRLAAGR